MPCLSCLQCKKGKWQTESRHLFKFAFCELKYFLPKLLTSDADTANKARNLLNAAQCLDQVYAILLDVLRGQW